MKVKKFKVWCTAEFPLIVSARSAENALDKAKVIAMKTKFKKTEFLDVIPYEAEQIMDTNNECEHS